MRGQSLQSCKPPQRGPDQRKIGIGDDFLYSKVRRCVDLDTRFALLLDNGTEQVTEIMDDWIERGVDTVQRLTETRPSVTNSATGGTVTVIAAMVDSSRLEDVDALSPVREFIQEFGRATQQYEVGVVVGDDYVGVRDFGHAS